MGSHGHSSVNPLAGPRIQWRDQQLKASPNRNAPDLAVGRVELKLDVVEP